MNQKAQRVAGMVSVMKKNIVQKHMRRSLVCSPNQRVIPVWSCRVHCVMEPVAAASGGVGSQTWYFVGDAAGGLLVLANYTGVRGLS